MLLRKIIAVKNVGRFQNYSASGDVTLKRYNLVFAENGRGKTTLCAILRSLQTGDAAYINGRTTLGGSEVPEVAVLTDAGAVSFVGGSWSGTMPTLTIFDSTFVSENVYSGDLVDLGHRRNLYRVIIGKDGVDLARKVDELDGELRALTAEIRDRRAEVQSHAPQRIDLDVFLPLGADPDIDGKIDGKRMELEAIRQANQLRARGTLAKIGLPVLPADFERVLGKTVQGLAADASRLVATQIQRHVMETRGEAWLSEGLGYIRDHKCPFCTQNVDGLPIVDAYARYFSEAYKALKQETQNLRGRIEFSLGERAIADTERVLDTNAAAAEFWLRYCDFDLPRLPDPSEPCAIASGPP